MWQRRTIAEIAASLPNAVNGGPFGSKLGRKDYVDDGVPVIRGVNLPEDRRFSTEGSVFVTCAKAEELKANLARPGDVVVTQRGTIGQVGIIPADSPYPRYVISQSQMKVSVDREVADPNFVYYALRAPTSVRRLQDHAMTAGVPHINLEMFRSFAIDVPRLSDQKKIATALGVYDELIENNLRRIEILEEMAQAIYREWFVNFRYPGHEADELVGSPLGPIPKGWEVSTIGEESSVVMGQSPKSEYYNNDGIGLPFHQGVTHFGSLFPEHVRYCTIKSRIAEVGDTLVSVRAPVGRINVADTRLVIGRGLAAVRPLDRHDGFHYRQLRHVFSEEDSMGGGTIYKAITKGDLLGVQWLVPPPEVKEAFESQERPLFALMSNLIRQNANLGTARDLLLPKLVSGEIDVSDLDIDTSWLVA